jgi:NAD(P)-dependent dehydrogenase (short-subunit alcohol dehydrogenase family)
VSLKDRVIVITGATGGLGKVVAATFAQAGASLALLSSDMTKLSERAQSLASSPAQISTHAVNLTDAAATSAAAEAVMARHQRVDALLHLVGGWSGGTPLAEVASADVASMLGQHVWTTFHLIQAFVPHLVQNGWGRVVAVSSPLATTPPAKGGPYAFAKAAEETMVLTLAHELQGTGVTANVLQVRTIDVRHERETSPTPKNASWTTPEEIAAAMRYLCSDEAQIISGARIPLFGGH